MFIIYLDKGKIMVASIYNYDNGSNFQYNPQQIEILYGRAQLKNNNGSYPTQPTDIKPNDGVAGMVSIIDFSVDSNITGMDSIKWYLSDGTDSWWFNTATNLWESFNGPFGTNLNTPQEITDNFYMFPGANVGAITIYPIAVLTSDDGTTTPTLTSLKIIYKKYIAPPAPPATTVLYGYLVNLLGYTPQVGTAKLIVESDQTVCQDGYIIRAGTSFIDFDNTGTCQFQAVMQPGRYFFAIQYKDDNGLDQESELGWATIPNAAETNLASLTYTPRQDSLD
jgi:hypothetical protein